MTEDIITRFLCCPACHHPTLSVQVLEADHRELRHAVVTCGRCATWYRLEEGLLELLVPSLRSTVADEAFCRRFRLDIRAGAEAAPTDDPIEHGHKVGQKSFYDQDAHSYEEHMMRLPFWRAFDSTFIDAIGAVNDRGGVMLEVGGGSGRLSIPLRSAFDLILSFDLSESMVRRAMKRLRDAEGESNVYYFVADAENIPVRVDVADVAILSGILHHVSYPERVIAETVRALKPGGRFLGVENNRTAFRPIFDLLMRLSRLWNEKAHPEHYLISERELRRWFGEAGVSGRVWTSVFLPPHLFNLFTAKGASRLLRATDAVARRIPGLAREGGLVVFCSDEVAGRSASLPPIL